MGIVYLTPMARVPQLGVAYLVFAIIWRSRKRITTDGRLFALYLGLYAVARV